MQPIKPRTKEQNVGKMYLDLEISIEERYDLIKRGLHLFEPSTTEESLKRLLAENNRPKVAWVTAPTGKPHIGYLVPLAKIIDFLRAGLQPTILYVDVYAYLVNCIHPLPIVKARLSYYRHLIAAVLITLGVAPEQVRHIAESSYAYTEAFITEFHKLSVLMKQKDAHCTSEVAETTMLSPLLCCIHQTLGEVFADMDIQFGGLDQQDLFRHSVSFLPSIDRKPREHIMNTMIPGLQPEPSSSPHEASTIFGGRSIDNKMSSSHSSDTKIEFLDNKTSLMNKLRSARCSPLDPPEDNAILRLLKDVIWPIGTIISERFEQNTGCNRSEGHNAYELPLLANQDVAKKGDIITITDDLMTGSARGYSSYEELEHDFVTRKIPPPLLKLAVTEALNKILEPIRAMYDENEEWKRLEHEAYPVRLNG